MAALVRYLYLCMKGYNTVLKFLRTLLTVTKVSDNVFRNFTTVKTFFRLVGLEVLETNTLRKIFSFWNTHFLNVKISEFSFKFFNNALGLNARVAHFVQGHDEACTFCSLKKVNPVPRETFDHIFFHCNFTEFSTSKLFERLLENKFLDESEKKFFALLGVYKFEGNYTWNIFSGMCSTILMYLIWECKLAKNCGSYIVLENNFISIIKTALKMSGEMRSAKIAFEHKLGLNLLWARG
jgi:hypothetical protein